MHFFAYVSYSDFTCFKLSKQYFCELVAACATHFRELYTYDVTVILRSDSKIG